MEQRPSETVETAVIGPNVMLREGLAHILRASNFRICASADYADSYVLSSLPRSQNLLLIIEACCDFDSTLRQIESFKRHCAAGRVVVLAHQYRLLEILSAFRAGANAYFANVTSTVIFTKFLELVVLGETILPQVLLTLLGDLLDRSDDQRDNDRYDREADATGAENIGEEKDNESEASPQIDDNVPQQIDDNVPRLSAQEILILSKLVRGDSNKAIARKMLIAEATVKVHVKAILRKIQVRNRTQAAIWAMNNRRLEHFSPSHCANGACAGTKID